jgi:hypothetical protein
LEYIHIVTGNFFVSCISKNPRVFTSVVTPAVGRKACVVVATGVVGSVGNTGMVVSVDDDSAVEEDDAGGIDDDDVVDDDNAGDEDVEDVAASDDTSLK